jgi:hypothetical protein
MKSLSYMLYVVLLLMIGSYAHEKEIFVKMLHFNHSSHGLRPGRHNPGGGEERGVQVGCIYVEPAPAQPI